MRVIDANEIPHSLLVPAGSGDFILPTISVNLFERFVYVLSKLEDFYLCIILNEKYNLISIPHTDTIRSLKARFPFIEEFYLGGPIDLEKAFLLMANYDGPVRPVFNNRWLDLLWINGDVEVGSFSYEKVFAFFGLLLINEAKMFEMLSGDFDLAKLNDPRDLFRGDKFLWATYGHAARAGAQRVATRAKFTN